MPLSPATIAYARAGHDRTTTHALDDAALAALAEAARSRWLVAWRRQFAFAPPDPTPQANGDGEREADERAEEKGGPEAPLLVTGGRTRVLCRILDLVVDRAADRAATLPWLHLGLHHGATLGVLDLSTLEEGTEDTPPPPPDRPQAAWGGVAGPGAPGALSLPSAGGADAAAPPHPQPPPALLRALGAGVAFRRLRGMGHRLDPVLAGALAQAQALLTWHDSHPFCPRCGAPSRPAGGGRHRLCTAVACAGQHFPRTDPVVLMLIEHPDGEHCLLARQRSFPPGRYSALAGYVEPGETLEAAVARETREEAGLEIEPPRYVASQPWPWPTNLMIGFAARARQAALTIDRTELEDARWFSRAEVAAMAAAEAPAWASLQKATAGPAGLSPAFGLPGPDALARPMILAWLDGSL